MPFPIAPIAVLLAACSDPIATMRADAKALLARPETAATTLELQNVLVACAGSIQSATRSQAEAEARAAEVYALARGGADFDTLVRQYSDDAAPGILSIARVERDSLTPAMGDVGFRLAVGEVGVAPFDPTRCKFGWLVLKRRK